MLKNFRRSVGLLYARWRFRRNGDAPQSLTDFFHRTRSILVVLPMRYEDAVVAGYTFKKLFDLLKNPHLTIITRGIRATALSNVSKSEVIRLEEADINKFFLPRGDVLQRICTRSYDIAIDLNLDFVLHAAYICKASRAPIRISVVHQHGDTFFNVQLNLEHTAAPQMIYEKFAQSLRMF